MRIALRFARAAVTAATVLASLAVLPATPAHAAGVATGISVTNDGTGYATVTDDGIVSTYGSVPWLGNPAGFSGSIVDISVTRDGGGYVAISSRGQVYAFGNVVHRGNVVNFPGDVADVSATQDGKGYVAVTTTGAVYAFGSVRYQGGLSGFGGTDPITAVAVRPDGEGYVVGSARGHIFTFNVPWHGEPVGFSGDIVDLAVTSSGEGYLAISSYGQVSGLNVPSRGDPQGFTGGITGVSVTQDGGGYIAVSGTHQRYAYGKVSYPGGAALGQQQNAKVGVNWSFGPVGLAMTNLDQELVVDDKAPQTFWANSFTWTTGGGGGYLGLQIDGERFDGTVGETAIFSIRNATASSGVNCGHFTGEGNGLSCRLPYPFESGFRRYRLRLTRQDVDIATGEYWWTASVGSTFPSDTGEQVIGSLRAPLGRSAVGSMSNFVEYFGPAVASPDLVPMSVAQLLQPTGNNDVTGNTYVATGTFRTSSTGSGTTADVHVLHYGDGSEGVRVRMGGSGTALLMGG
ncbi:MAG TPA: DUF3472 domain-containing protein [Mycobacteriales bacterium]|jgi:hypothetical protein|nr:DUF3472 domain-containing protein [Mycobacteriales bacterium]